MLKIRSEQEGTTRTYYLEGEIDYNFSKTFEEEVKTEGCDKIIFDFEKLAYITSAGIRVILAINLDMKKKGGHIEFRNENKSVHDIFDMTAVYAVIK